MPIFNCPVCGRIQNMPQTNADLIRNMKDEELADLFWNILHERDLIMIQKLNDHGIEASLIEMPDRDFSAHLKWLQQIADDDG